MLVIVVFTLTVRLKSAPRIWFHGVYAVVQELRKIPVITLTKNGEKMELVLAVIFILPFNFTGQAVRVLAFNPLSFLFFFFFFGA